MDETLDKKLQQNYNAGFTTNIESDTLPPGLKRYNTTDQQNKARTGMVVAVQIKSL